MNRDVHPGLSGHTRRSPGSDSGEPACPVINRPNAVSANRAFKRAACCCRRTAFRQLCGTCVPARYDSEMQPMLPGILHIRPCGAGSEPVVYPSLCRHAVRPSRIRSHRTYSLSGLISSLKVMTRDSDRACSLFRGKPSQKPLTIPIRKRYDRPDGLPESDSGIQGIRTHDNMPRLLLHCHDPLLHVAAKTEAVSSKRVHRQSSLPFADALLLRIPVLFGR